MHSSKEVHLQAANQVPQYLKGSPGKGILFKRNLGLVLEVYTNADYAGFVVDRRSITGVPRSLIPGARSSRLKDRQKEERELLVKQAFIEDMLNENNLLSVLLGKGSTVQCCGTLSHYRLSTKEPQLSTEIATVSTKPRENISQPSDRASMEFLHADHPLVEDRAGDTETMKSYCPSAVHGTSKGPVSGFCGLRKDLKLIKDGKESSIDANSLSSEVTESIKLDRVHFTSASNWGLFNTALDQSKLHSAGDLPPVPDLSLPPESLQMPLELLQPKGGASMLIIAIQAHATTVAEEIGHPFNYNEIPLDTASQEDLNLINLAIDDEEHVECGEDWTSKLGINLQYCVKVRKNSPSKQVPHALALGWRGGESAGLDFYACFGKSEMLHEVQVLEATEDLSKNAVPAQVINPLVTATPVVKSGEARIKNQTLEDEACNSVTCDGSEMPIEI
ncbi:putative lysine-specific demethylase ELF6 [Vitis vinifera]|uniref:Putative lysine-specific demethylase ELF6 n=1 Tax=Vitis vinifera TaxID=29760 RepID=A0A438GPL4_VITVI|nr:putative lysine-specific demethylase ELF6 [Vitis vinifera]